MEFLVCDIDATKDGIVFVPGTGAIVVIIGTGSSEGVGWPMSSPKEADKLREVTSSDSEGVGVKPVMIGVNP